MKAVKAWKEEILVVLHSKFALDLSWKIDLDEKFRVRSSRGGGMLIIGPWFLRNHRFVIGGREMGDPSFCLEICDHTLKKCQKEVPSPTE
ncbi:hypothetical protein ACHQM5_023929 [Ranunculus cassubicifolius]